MATLTIGEEYFGAAAVLLPQDTEKLVERLEETPELQPAAERKRNELETLRPMIQKYLDRIDPDRLNRIRNSAGRNFCCLSSRELARRVNLSHWHSGLYGFYSLAVHAADFDEHGYFDDQRRFKLKWYNDSNVLAFDLLHACRLILAVTASIHDVFDLQIKDELTNRHNTLGQLENTRDERVDGSSLDHSHDH